MESEILLVCGRFKIDNTVSIGSGAFSRVHPATDLDTQREVAVKIMLTRHGAEQVQTESKVLKQLQGRNFPRLYWHGIHQGMETEVMQRLGRSVLDLFLECGRKFSLATVLQLGEQLLPALKELHSLGYIHMDLKPDNLVMGRDAEEDTVYIIDFGLAEMIMPHKKHIKMKKGLKFKGNVFWASMHLLNGISGSRRDDLEAFMYVLIYLLKGELPWQQLRDRRNRTASVKQIKSSTSLADLCQSLPPSFLRVFEYIRSLCFSDEPNYDWIRQQLREAAERAGVKFDAKFEWKEAPQEYGQVSQTKGLKFADSADDDCFSGSETSGVPYECTTPMKARSGIISSFHHTSTLPRHSRANPKQLMAALHKLDTGSRSPGSLMLSRQSSFKNSCGDSAGEVSPCADIVKSSKRTFSEVSKQVTERVKRCEGTQHDHFKVAVLLASSDSSPSDEDTPRSEFAPALTQVIREKLSKPL